MLEKIALSILVIAIIFSLIGLALYGMAGDYCVNHPAECAEQERSILEGEVLTESKP